MKKQFREHEDRNKVCSRLPNERSTIGARINERYDKGKVKKRRESSVESWCSIP